MTPEPAQNTKPAMSGALLSPSGPEETAAFWADLGRQPVADALGFGASKRVRRGCELHPLHPSEDGS